MKQTATNQFQDGLNYDLHPIVTPNSVLTDNLNGTFITYNGNEFCLQNDRGNTIRATLSAGFTPIGIKEHNGVLYIVSCNGEGKSEIGTYPGIDWSGEKEKPRPFLDKYTPLHNYVLDAKSDPFDNNEPKFTYSDLRTNKFNFDKSNPVSIEVQDSYDGSINLILTDGKNNPKLINTGFSVIGEQYKLIESNVYLTEEGFEAQTALIKKPVSFARIELENVYTGGQLPGGNYTFYVRLGDADGNMTNIIAESGIVSIFKGTVGQPSTISGTLADERTDKMVSLKVSPLNSGYPKVYLYYVREYSDTQGFLMNEAKQLVEPFDVNMTSAGNFCNITVTGYEDITSVSIEDLNIQYYSNDTVKTMTQQQDMLFAGGITVDTYSPDDFTKYAQLIKTSLSRYNPDENLEVDNITGVTNNYEGDAEYYNVQNIYNKVGYWPGEYYRFGIVFILNNGSNSNVFNMIGGNIDFDTVITKNANCENLNEMGVFKTCMQDSSNAIISDSAIVPWHFKFDTSVMKNEIKKDDAPIKGFFIVRQKRIPEAIIQGLQIGIEQNTHLPCTNLINAANIETETYDQDNRLKYPETIDENDYVMESFCGHYSRWNNNSEYYHTNDFTNKLTYMPVTAYGTSIVRTRKYKVAIPVKLSCWGPPNASLAVILSVLDGVIPWLLPFAIPAKIIWANDIYAKECSTTYYAIMEYDENGENGEIQKICRDPETFELREVQQYWFNTNNKSFVESSNYGDENPWVTWKPDKKAWPGTYITDDRWYQIRTEVIDNKDKYIGKLVAETFKTDPIKKSSIEQSKEFISRLFPVTPDGYCSGILSVEAMVTPQLKTKLNGSKMVVDKIGEVTIQANDDDTVNERLLSRRAAINKYNYTNQITLADNGGVRAVYVERNVKTKVVDNCAFSTIAGNPYDPSDFGKTFSEDLSDTDLNYANLLYKVVRGKYTPYIGLCDNISSDDGSNLIQLSLRTNEPNAYDVRKQDKSPFYTVSDRHSISDDTDNDIHVYRGDCYVTTQTIRLNSNFIDPSYPFTDKIVNPDGWKEAVKKYVKDEDRSFGDADITDLNTVGLGYWLTFKCLASTNLAFRSEDVFDTQTTAMMGNPRSFFPLSGSTATSDKQDESELMNAGYGITVGEIRYQEQPDVPYIKQEYGTRVIFSNKNVTDAFVNGYRVFQGASYQDYDKQYGNIVKLLPWGNNLFCVFEHGLALLPINEKALMQTTTDQTIHIYGHGVLPEQMTIISHDYGSKYPDSVIRTPIGIYGVDTDAKKIWRYSDKQGFETLSDMKIESFLNDNLFTDKAVKIETCDVRTHYNAFKGDVMFTFYNNDGDNYFKIDTSDVVLNIDESKTIKCYTNLPDKDITITTIGNVKVNYVNGELTITGIAIGSSKVLINDNIINVKVKDSQETFNYLELSRSSIPLSIGQSITLVPNTNVSNPEYTWRSSNINVATVDQYGTITAVKTGSCIISVTINNTTYSASCRVEVREDRPIEIPDITDDVVLSTNNLVLAPGDTGTIRATSEGLLTWASSNEDVATVSDESWPSINITAINIGEADIQALNGGKVVATCHVTVKSNVIYAEHITIEPNSITINKGESLQLRAFVTPSNADNRGVYWSAPQGANCTVDQTGKIVGINEGTRNIFATSVDNNAESYIQITVNDNTVAVNGVSLDYTNITLSKGETMKLIATVTPSNATDKSVTWFVEQAGIVRVNQSGNVTAIQPGQSSVWVKTKDGNYRTSCSVKVLEDSNNEGLEFEEW